MGKFIKHDQEKIDPTLVQSDFIMDTAQILEFGAKKYGRENWMLCDDVNRYRAAAMRHLLAYNSGEKCDPETGKSHLAHVACCIMFVMHFDREAKVECSTDCVRN